MKSLKIKTCRKATDYPFWDLVYEWEDEFKNRLNASFSYRTKLDRYINKFINITNTNMLFPSIPSNSCYTFMWDLSARSKDNRYNRPDIIPNIIDFYVSKDQLKYFHAAYCKHPFILISSLEVLHFLQKNNFPLKMYHFPLSIADCYRINPTMQFEKKYDTILLGRQNNNESPLTKYMKLYSEKHSDFIYVYRVVSGKPGRMISKKNVSFDYYTSKGEFLGNISNRTEYIELIKKCKTGLYSTHGIDGGEKITKGFNQVTPRFLELVAGGCHVITRYKENPDTDFYQFNEFSSNINTYDDFEKQMNIALSKPVNMKKYSDYLENHYTSKRVELLKDIFEKEGIEVYTK
ncbi:MAG: glycosyltransferase family 1 protein [Prevotellaceae bacterium]|nr:glycosyltransferase family 1 protein [Prevotellaceae bacterium]